VCSASHHGKSYPASRKQPAQAQQDLFFCVNGFGVKQRFVQNTVLTQKQRFCSNHGLSLNQSMCVSQGIGKGHIE
jgi:hypothetical protein